MEFCKHCYQKDEFSLIQDSSSPTWYEGGEEEISAHLKIRTYFCLRCHDVSIEAELHDDESIESANQDCEIFSPEIKLLYPEIKPLGKDYFQEIKSNWVHAHRPEDKEWWVDYCFPDGEGIAELRQAYDDMLFCLGHKKYSLCSICARKILDILSKIITLKNDAGALDAKLRWMEKESLIDKATLAWAITVKEFGNKSVHGNLPSINQEDARTIVLLINYLLDSFFVIIPASKKLENFNEIEVEVEIKIEDAVEQANNGISDNLITELRDSEKAEDHLKGLIVSVSLFECKAYLEEATDYLVRNFHRPPYKPYKDKMKNVLKSFESQVIRTVKNIFSKNSDICIKKNALEIICYIENGSEALNDFLVEAVERESDDKVKESIMKSLLDLKLQNILELHKKHKNG